MWPEQTQLQQQQQQQRCLMQPANTAGGQLWLRVGSWAGSGSGSRSGTAAIDCLRIPSIMTAANN